MAESSVSESNNRVSAQNSATLDKMLARERRYPLDQLFSQSSVKAQTFNQHSPPAYPTQECRFIDGLADDQVLAALSELLTGVALQ